MASGTSGGHLAVASSLLLLDRRAQRGRLPAMVVPTLRRHGAILMLVFGLGLGFGFASCASAPPARQADLWLDIAEKKIHVNGVREGSVLSVTVSIPQDVDEPWRDQQRLARAENVSLDAWLDRYPLPRADQPRPGVLPFAQTPTGGYGLAHYAFDLPADVRSATVRFRVRLRDDEREFTLVL